MKTSISQITTIAQSFADDLDTYQAAGAAGVGIWETKLGDDSLERFRASGLESAAAVPVVPSILPLPLMEGPDDPAERVEALCASVGRLAPFEPLCVLFLTGPDPTRLGGPCLGSDPRHGPAGRVWGQTRDTLLKGIRAVADAGERTGVRVALEPIQREFAEFWTIPTSLAEAAALLEEAGRPDVGLVYDVWHLWNQPVEEIARYRDRIAAVHVADWREPTRNTNDRVLPGDGVIEYGPIFDALRWDGLYDLEIFSDPELPDSLWREDPRELARRGVEALSSVFA